MVYAINYHNFLFIFFVINSRTFKFMQLISLKKYAHITDFIVPIF